MGGSAAFPARGQRTKKSRASSRIAIFYCLRVDEESASHKPSANAGPLQDGVGGCAATGSAGTACFGAATAAPDGSSAPPRRTGSGAVREAAGLVVRLAAMLRNSFGERFVSKPCQSTTYASSASAT